MNYQPIFKYNDWLGACAIITIINGTIDIMNCMHFYKENRVLNLMNFNNATLKNY